MPLGLVMRLRAGLALRITGFCLLFKAIALGIEHRLLILGQLFTREEEVELIPAELRFNGFGLALR